MAGTVNLQIWADSMEMKYDPQTFGDGQENIPCTTFNLLGNIATDPKTGAPKGSRDWGEGIRVTKRIDATSTQLVGLFTKSVAVKATFTFSAPDIGQNAQASQATLAITIGEKKRAQYTAWLRSYRLIAPDTDVAAADNPTEPYEELVFSFTKIKFERMGVNNEYSKMFEVVDDDLSSLHGA